MHAPLVVSGRANRSSRYTSIPMHDAGDPTSKWTVYVNSGHTDYRPLGGTEVSREKRSRALAEALGGVPKKYRKDAKNFTLWLCRTEHVE